MRFYEFFAGAGLVTLGLGSEWECVWANDIDPKKAWVYRSNFGDSHFHLGDVAGFDAKEMPNHTQLAWASFPCQDLSLAGWRRGLSSDRSGTFWPFWKIMRSHFEMGHRPPLIVLENVVGMLHGDGFSGLCEALAALGMQFGAVVMDAREFLPQSRPRVFVIAVDERVDCSSFTLKEGVKTWTPSSLLRAHELLSPQLARSWRWWKVPVPDHGYSSVEQLIERNPSGVDWHTPAETKRLLALMNKLHRDRITEALATGKRSIGFVYKRIREGVQRAEIRFDGIAGCLRTPGGGSSRQTVVVVENGAVRSRLLSPREAARLMGVPDSFKLPNSYNDAYKAMGDAVAVPVVSWLGKHLLEPLAQATTQKLDGKHSRNISRTVARTEERVEGWSKEHRRMAPKKLTEASIAALAAWHSDLDKHKLSLDSFIACAGLKVAELTRKEWPIERSDYVSRGGRFRSSGPFIQKILERMGEEREYTSEGGRTTGSCIDAAARLVESLEKVPGYSEASIEDRAAIADELQMWILHTIVKPSLDSEGLKVEIDLHKTPPAIVGDILSAAMKQKVSGAVAQHLVGAKLALRYPKRDIENHGHTTQDRQLGRKGDFELNDTIIHVTMTPGEQVVAKCAKNVRDGYNALLLVPEAELLVASAFVKRNASASKIWVQSIESFIGQNVAEIGEFGKDGLRDNVRLLLQKYNARVEQVETRRALSIKVPENL